MPSHWAVQHSLSPHLQTLIQEPHEEYSIQEQISSDAKISIDPDLYKERLLTKATPF
jgi:hypothetical protein